MEKRVTQRTIAEEVGCSIMTVSLALRDDPRVNADTRERVRSIAVRLGYQPDPLLSALNHYRDQRKLRMPSAIAVLSTRFEQRFWRENSSARKMMTGMRTRCDELGYTLDMLVVDRRMTRDERIEAIIHNRGIRGMIVGPVALEKRYLEFKWSDLSAVAIGGSLDDAPIPAVLPDYWRDTLLALDKTRELTSGPIGMLLTDEADQHSRGQWAGAFLHWQANQTEQLIAPSFVEKKPTGKWLERYLRKRKPAAVLYRHAELPAAVLRLPRRLRDSVLWVALNRSEHAPAHFPGIVQGREQMGRLLVELVHRGLLDAASSRSLTGVRHFVPGEWVNPA